ncbi:MAG: transcription-repair coupling factor, partial [Bacilli bacterium]
MFENIFNINEINNKIVGLSNELKCIYGYNVFKQLNNSIIMVCNSLYEANKMYQSLCKYSNDVLFFPMDDFLTSEALATSPELKVSRLETLNNLINNNKKIVVTNLMGFLRFLPAPSIYKKKIITLKVNDNIKISDLVIKLNDIGYIREAIVNKTGEIAVRGFIVDIFPVASSDPIRIEYWGDQIESIKKINVETQLTVEKIFTIDISPNIEFLTNKTLNLDNVLHRQLVKYEKVFNINAYIDKPIIIYNNYEDILSSYNLLVEEMFEYSQTIKCENNIQFMNELDSFAESNAIYFTLFDDKIKNITNKQQYKIKELSRFKGKIAEINQQLNDLLKHYKIIVCLQNKYQATKVINEFNNSNFFMTKEKEIFNSKINIIIKDIKEGFIFGDLMVISDKELFNQKDNKINYKTNFKLGTKIRNINKLNIGDYVVHYAHGIGQYCGLTTLTKNGLKKDYLQIMYKGNDKLYIPVEQIELISKYTCKEGMKPVVNSLNSDAWHKTKGKLKIQIADMAPELLALYAKRQAMEGFGCKSDDDDNVLFAKQFIYTPTFDQIRTYEEIRKDMEKKRPMDRLLCGDVGYGKTEVAFRAIFKAIMSGKQAAILCPTTILSSQHYNNAILRFKEFPINIVLLNRFVSTKQVKENLIDIKDGKVDVVIGTHRILSDDVIYKDLGLLVIDEEQRFGVKHKEKIKQYKNIVDVLTLSATPIPRTLQMSMTGIRDLSLIETPPVNRYPVQTYVLKENRAIIRDAIYKELARGGQIFILYNKIDDMEQKVAAIHNMVPEAKIIFAHGRMGKQNLENVMLEFINKKYDVLVCTTIIETGIDIPTVNTLIVLDSDRFGLSQLYQIRGRVGRSDKIAYCYLMYNERKILSDVAVKRLKAIKEFTELGSGFKIAMRDLSIRGAGDILGSQQAGFISLVGIDLFLKMLTEEIERLKGGIIKKEKLVEKSSLINVETTVDSKIVMEEELKIEIHQKINMIKNYDELCEIRMELEDRFGKLPENIIVYMYEKLFESLASILGITNVNQTNNFIQIILPKELTNKVDGKNLFMDVSLLNRMFRFGMRGNMMLITLDIVKLDKHFIYYLVDLLVIIKKR